MTVRALTRITRWAMRQARRSPDRRPSVPHTSVQRSARRSPPLAFPPEYYDQGEKR